MKSKSELMNTLPTHTIKKTCLLEKSVGMWQNHLFFESTRQRHAIKLAAVGGGEDKLLRAGIPGYDAVFVVVILRGFTEELGDVLYGLVVRCSVLIAGARFCDEGNARDILSIGSDAKLAGIVEINSLECIEILSFLATPLERVDRLMRVEKSLPHDHAGANAVHIQRLWGLSSSGEPNDAKDKEDEKEGFCE